MTLVRLVFANLIYHRRINLAVLLGVATATAVLTGALLVGDSVRGSLRKLVLGRLGSVDYALVAQRFFRDELVDEVSSLPGFGQQCMAAEGLTMVRGSLKNQEHGDVVSGVTVFGCRPGFWDFGDGGPAESPVGKQIVLNARLASADFLNVEVGDSVVLQIGRPSEIPADSPLGRKIETVRRRTYKVSEILDAEGLGRFGLSPSQQLPINAFVELGSLQSLLDADGKLNAILIATKLGGDAPADVLETVVPKLADYGLQLDAASHPANPHSPALYFDLTSQRMLLDNPTMDATDQAWRGRTVQPVITYLANWITVGDRRIPYSTVTAIDSIDELGPLIGPDGVPMVLADDEIVLNDWAATDLQAEPGAEVAITFFAPETTHGQVAERTETFRLKAIVPLGGDGRPRTLAGDARLTPELKGVTDQESIDDWDPPFPYDSQRVRDQDEDYWDEYRATPKAFVSLAAGRRMWSSRFGDTTSLRVLAGDDSDAAELRAGLESQLGQTGALRFRAVKRQALEAASGTTPFGVLFLGFSMFLIAAAVMLVVLLFRLGVDGRAAEVGLLLAVGFSRRRVLKLLLLEALLVADLGALIGVAGGVGYAALMLAGLRGRWLDAVTTPFLRLDWTVGSLVLGYVCGLAACGFAIAWSLWRWRHTAIRPLLAGDAGGGSVALLRGGGWRRWGVVVALGLAGLLIPAALGQHGELQAGLFFLAGGVALTAGLLGVSMLLRSSGRRSAPAGALGLLGLAVRNVARNAQRSTLTIGLVAAASFLIIAISAFRLEDVESGGGGFDLLATSAVPLHFDLGTDAGQFELGLGGPDVGRLLDETTIVSVRVHDGDDASCLNLYRPRQPRVLGLPKSMPGQFRWAGSVGKMPWEKLNRPLGQDAAGRAVVPVVLDKNTAMYSLQLWNGVGETLQIEDAAGRPVTLQVVGLLKNSIFQGDVLMAERQLLRLFPDTAGYRYFLLRSPAAQAQQVRSALEEQLADFGFDVVPVRQRMAALFAVQNTYLSTFQSLGGLGLLLGMLGLATVQVRSVLARRSELAVMRATGFRRGRLAGMVLLENVFLLVMGLGIGVAASLLAVIPHFVLGDARIPWESLAATLSLVLCCGLIAGLAAVRATLRAPLLPALRGQ